jgi:hypothetical protein
MDTLRAALERVTQSGALACAPRELALARSHYDFAQTELQSGHTAQAQRHIAVAEQNVGAAQVLTPDRGCESVRDEVPATPSSSMQTRSAMRATGQFGEADGGRSKSAFPVGAVNENRLNAARLTAHVYGETRLDVAIAMSSNVLSIGDLEL